MDESPPDLTPEPGWSAAPDLGVYRPERSFMSNDDDRLRLSYWVREEDRAFVGKVWYGPRAEGPPLSAHGGSLAATLDDAMGRGLWVAGYRVLAGTLEFKLRSRTPLYEIHHIETRMVREEGRKVFTEGRITARDGTLRAEGTGTFVKITAEVFAAELERLRAAGFPIWNTDLRAPEDESS
jgi:acyl-coenzyme A thioesterase PaaI-like protein